MVHEQTMFTCLSLGLGYPFVCVCVCVCTHGGVVTRLLHPLVSTRLWVIH